MQKPLLIDLDGVLRLGNDPAPDLEEFLYYLESESVNACILSNSSISNSEQIYNYFDSHSIRINLPIITAIDAAYSYIKGKYNKVAVFTSENVISKFAEFLDFENPEAVLIGDIGEMWNYKLMQTIFEYIRNGAKLIVVHKNKFWNKPNFGIQLDAGPFIHGIEYATSSEAILIGKPSKKYFKTALKKINVNLDEQFMMLGDDLETDINGSKNLGAETILVYTGKTNKPLLEYSQKNVDYEANNLLDVLKILKEKKNN